MVKLAEVFLNQWENPVSDLLQLGLFYKQMRYLLATSVLIVYCSTVYITLSVFGVCCSTLVGAMFTECKRMNCGSQSLNYLHFLPVTLHYSTVGCTPRIPVLYSAAVNNEIERRSPGTI